MKEGIVQVISEYKTLFEDKEINEHLNDGWELYGSPCAMPSSPDQPFYVFQAMVKKAYRR